MRPSASCVLSPVVTWLPPALSSLRCSEAKYCSQGSLRRSLFWITLPESCSHSFTESLEKIPHTQNVCTPSRFYSLPPPSLDSSPASRALTSLTFRIPFPLLSYVSLSVPSHALIEPSDSVQWTNPAAMTTTHSSTSSAGTASQMRQTQDRFRGRGRMFLLESRERQPPSPRRLSNGRSQPPRYYVKRLRSTGSVKSFLPCLVRL